MSDRAASGVRLVAGVARGLVGVRDPSVRRFFAAEALVRSDPRLEVGTCLEGVCGLLAGLAYRYSERCIAELGWSGLRAPFAAAQ